MFSIIKVICHNVFRTMDNIQHFKVLCHNVFQAMDNIQHNSGALSQCVSNNGCCSILLGWSVTMCFKQWMLFNIISVVCHNVFQTMDNVQYH
jgi:hypothetical protein